MNFIYQLWKETRMHFCEDPLNLRAKFLVTVEVIVSIGTSITQCLLGYD